MQSSVFYINKIKQRAFLTVVGTGVWTEHASLLFMIHVTSSSDDFFIRFAYNMSTLDLHVKPQGEEFGP